MKTKTFLSLILVVLLVAPLWAKGPNGPSNTSGLTITEKDKILYFYFVTLKISVKIQLTC